MRSQLAEVELVTEYTLLDGSPARNGTAVTLGTTRRPRKQLNRRDVDFEEQSIALSDDGRLIRSVVLNVALR
jgi:hypothetical protein